MILNDECGVFSPMLLDCLEEINGKLKSNLNDTFFDDEEDEFGKNNGEVIHYNEEDKSNQEILSAQAYHFLADRSPDIVFTYNADPPSLSLNRSAQVQWDIPTYISDPLTCNTLKNIISKDDLDKLKALISSASPDNPETAITMAIKGKKYDIRTQVIFNGGLSQSMRGVVGTCTQANI